MLNAISSSPVGSSSAVYSASDKIITPTRDTMEAASDKVSLSAESLAKNAEAAANKYHDEKMGQFESEMRLRLSASTKTDGSKPSEAELNMMVKSLSAAVNQVGEILGQDAAEAVKEKVLSATESGETGSYAIGLAFSEVLNDKELNKTIVGDKTLRDFFNKDDAYHYDGNSEARDKAIAEGKTMGLSYALNHFFGDSVNETIIGTKKALSFGSDNIWQRQTVIDNIAKGERAAEIEEPDPEDPVDLQNIGIKEVDARAVDGIVDFIEKDLGDKLWAKKVEEEFKGNNDFISAVDDLVAKSFEKMGTEGAKKFISFLNSDVKSAINSNSKITNQKYGAVYFEGWKFEVTHNQVGEEEYGISNSWKVSDSGGYFINNKKFTDAATMAQVAPLK